MKLNLQSKYTLVILSLIISVVIISAGTVMVQSTSITKEVIHASSENMEDNLLEQLRKRATVFARFLSNNLTNPVYQYDMETIYDITKAAQEQKDVIYVYVYGPTGKIIHDGTKQLSRLGKILDNEVSNKTVAAKTLIIQETDSILDIAMPIKIQGQFLGGVRIGFSLKGIRTDIRKMKDDLERIGKEGRRRSISTIGAMVIVLSAAGVIVALFIARGLSKPIATLSKLTSRIGRGEYNVDIHIKRSDEIGELASSFRNMAQDLAKTVDNLNREIIQRKKAEQALQKLNKDLESTVHELSQSNKQLQDFVYIAAHDLKTPLRGIGTLADWIATDYAGKFDEQGKEQVKLLTTRAERTVKLIDRMLEYSKIVRHRQKEKEIDLNTLLTEVIAQIAPPENIEITVEKELPTIICERKLLDKVFYKLLSNAVKFMDKPQGQIRIGCIEEEGFWKFSVTDNGPGIKEEYFEKIFQIFQTLSPRDEFESTGIGLTVAKKIVELYGGKIWVESKMGEGSTFFFTLPKQEGSRKAGPQMEVKDAKLQAGSVGGRR
ncbi:MAG: ATP-binding protein [Sedimentisphaerales bacterium]